jgi:predicted nucleic acid-binding protein
VRLVLDTNVMISGVYFSGPPYDILDAWRRGRIEFVVSVEILDEPHRLAAADGTDRWGARRNRRGNKMEASYISGK